MKQSGCFVIIISVFFQALFDILSQSAKVYSGKLNCECSVSDSDDCRVQCDCCGFLWWRQ